MSFIDERMIYDENGKRLSNKIGVLSDLQTQNKDSLVGAVNENVDDITKINEDIGDLTELQTTDKTSLTNALNEHNEKITSSAYYPEVTYKKLRDDTSNTDYYLTSIPYKDSQGNVIQIKRGFAMDNPNSGVGETARSFANRHNTSVTINASVFDMTTLKFTGTDVYNGVAQNDGSVVSRYVLGIKNDNTFVVYPPGTTSQTIINDGCQNALTSFIPLIQNGTQVDSSILNGYGSVNLPYRRQVIAQYANKDIVILTCESDSAVNQGMTCYDLIRILQNLGVQFAFMLDGGGSTQTVVRGTLLNTAKDGNGYVERLIPDFLYVGKDIPTNRDKDIVSINQDVGNLSKKLDDKVLDITSTAQMKKITQDDGNVTISNSDTNQDLLASIVNKGFGMNTFYCIDGAINAPSSKSSRGISFINQVGFGFVVAIDSDSQAYVNYLNNSVWSGWNPLVSNTLPSWTNITLQNGVTVSNSRTPRYALLSNGRVSIDGEITGVNSGTIIGTLPSGIHPTSTKIFSVPLNSSSIGYATITINSSGQITVLGTSDSTKAISLCGIEFFIN